MATEMDPKKKEMGPKEKWLRYTSFYTLKEFGACFFAMIIPMFAATTVSLNGYAVLLAMSTSLSSFVFRRSTMLPQNAILAVFMQRDGDFDASKEPKQSNGKRGATFLCSLVGQFGGMLVATIIPWLLNGEEFVFTTPHDGISVTSACLVEVLFVAFLMLVSMVLHVNQESDVCLNPGLSTGRVAKCAITDKMTSFEQQQAEIANAQADSANKQADMAHMLQCAVMGVAWYVALTASSGYSGGSLNYWRTLAPAVLSNNFQGTYLWAYGLSHLLGAGLICAVYACAAKKVPSYFKKKITPAPVLPISSDAKYKAQDGRGDYSQTVAISCSVNV